MAMYILRSRPFDLARAIITEACGSAAKKLPSVWSHWGTQTEGVYLSHCVLSIFLRFCLYCTLAHALESGGSWDHKSAPSREGLGRGARGGFY